jgi:hypothetical protein
MMTDQRGRAQTSADEHHARLGSSALVSARLVVVLLVQAGCYVYVPTTIDAVPDGAGIRALVSSEAEDRIRSTYGINNGRTLTGSLLSRDREQVSLYLPSVPMGTGLGTKVLYQQIPVAKGDILRIDARRLDAFRTGFAAVGAAAVLVVAARHAFVGGQGGPPSGGGGSTDARSVPLWRITLCSWRP